MDSFKGAEGLFVNHCRGLVNRDYVSGKGIPTRTIERWIERFQELERWVLTFWDPKPPPATASFIKELEAERQREMKELLARRSEHDRLTKRPYSRTTKASLLLAEFFVRTTGQQQPRRVAQILYKGGIARGTARARRLRDATSLSRLSREYPRQQIELVAAKLRENPFHSNKQLAEMINQSPEAVDEIRCQLAEAKKVPDAEKLESNMRKRLERGIPNDPRFSSRDFLFEATWFMHITSTTRVPPPDQNGRYGGAISVDERETDLTAAIWEYRRRRHYGLLKPPEDLAESADKTNKLGFLDAFTELLIIDS